MDFSDFVLTVLLPIFIAAGVTFLLNNKYETDRRKRRVLSDFMAYRNAITENPTESNRQMFLPIMNRIIIEFDKKDINSMLRKFQREQNPENKTALLTDIIHTMIQKLGVKHLERNDALIKHPFRPD